MDYLEEFLEEQNQQNLLRKLKPASQRKDGKITIRGKEYFDFSSNDYLGISNHPKIIEATREAVAKYGTSAAASRLLSGDLDIFHNLEKELAKFKGKESALILNSGYQANVGIIKALIGKGDAVFSDKLSHASIVDGILLSGAQLFRYHHNDVKHLEMLLKKYRNKYRRALIITESVFSMDGDFPPLKEIVTLKNQHHCTLMVDEAHATGIFGKNGSGKIEEENLIDQIDVSMGTFGKALGSFGAYVAASKTLTQYLINTCRSFIYSTALPPSVIAANLASLAVIKNEPERRQSLLKNAKYFRDQLSAGGLKVKGESQIVPLIVGDAAKCVALSKKLIDAGYWVLPIRPPTVPNGEARLRFSLTYHHSPEVLEKLIEEIKNV